MTAQPVDIQQSEAAAAGVPAVARPGAITLTRHGQPELSRRCWLTSEGYRYWWSQYEVLGLRRGQTPPDALLETARDAETIFSSTRPRAIESAAAVCQGREVTVDSLFVEAPLPPPKMPDWFKMSPRWWGVLARITWHLGHGVQGHETREQAEARAEQAAQVLIARAETGQDILVLAHGYFNHMVGRQLKANGWRLVKNQGFKYWSQRRFERGHG